MEATNEALFQVQRFNILSSARSGFANSGLTPAYVYAWDAGIYPAFHDTAEWHAPFKPQFTASKEQVLELGKYLDEKWLAKEAVTFYELESRYDIRGSSPAWDRGTLIDACRYMYLNKMFDENFWDTLINPGDCPTEAKTISYTYEEKDLYLL